MADSGSSPADPAGGVDFAASNLDKPMGEIGNAASFDRTDIHDPQHLLDYKREKIEADHGGLRGVLGSIYSTVGIQPSYHSEMDQLSDAEGYTRAGDVRFSADASAQQERTRLRQLQAGLDAQLASAGKTQYQQQLEAANQTYTDELQAANEIANNRTYRSQGFHSQAEANQYAAHLKNLVAAVHDAEVTKLQRANLIDQEQDQLQLSILNQEASGDVTGAARTTLEMHLDAQEDAIDPNDKNRLNTFAEIRDKTLANFEVGVARQKKMQTEQFDDQIAEMHEKSKEAQLRAAGKTNVADAAHLQFDIDQQVRSFHEKADAEPDPVKKNHLLQLAEAAQETGKEQLDALQKEQQRHNAQAPALNSAAHGAAGLDDALAGKLTDAAKKLDDAATKLDRAVAGPNKSLTSVKD
jgi:hypothetical protein